MRIENLNIVGGTNVGGLAGASQHVTTKNSYATGDVSSNDRAGGLIGFLFRGVFSYEELVINSYRNSAATISASNVSQEGIPIASGGAMTGGNWSDPQVWKSNIAFPELS